VQPFQWLFVFTLDCFSLCSDHLSHINKFAPEARHPHLVYDHFSQFGFHALNLLLPHDPIHRFFIDASLFIEWLVFFFFLSFFKGFLMGEE
jgi:hypothetical protein